MRSVGVCLRECISRICHRTWCYWQLQLRMLPVVAAACAVSTSARMNALLAYAIRRGAVSSFSFACCRVVTAACAALASALVNALLAYAIRHLWQPQHCALPFGGCCWRSIGVCSHECSRIRHYTWCCRQLKSFARRRFGGCCLRSVCVCSRECGRLHTPSDVVLLAASSLYAAIQWLLLAQRWRLPA